MKAGLPSAVAPLLLALLPTALGCTNFLVTKSASADGTNVIT